MRPALIVGLFTFLIFILTSSYSNSNMFNNTQVKLFSILVIIMILNIPFALYRRGAFEFLFMKYSSIILFFFIFFHVVDSLKKLKKIIFLCCLGEGLYTASALIKGGIISGRIYFSSMFDPNDLAFFSLSFLPLNLIFFSRDNNFTKRFICMINFITGILLILGTGSRGGVVGFSIIALMLLGEKNEIFKFSNKIIFTGLILIAILTKVVTINIERYQSIGNIDEDYNITAETGRLEIWKTGLKLMLNRPFTGVGINCFPEAIGKDRLEKGITPRWQTAHNSIIQIGTEIGILGFILFALLSFRAFRIFGKVRKEKEVKDLAKIAEMARIGFLGHFIAAMFLSQAYSVYWAFYIVLSTVINQLLGEDKRKSFEIFKATTLQ